MQKQNKKLIVVTGAFAAVFLVASVAIARPGGFFTKDAERAKTIASYVVDDVLDDIDARDDQRREVHALKDRVITRALGMKAEKDQVREELTRILSAENPSSDRVHALVEEQSKKLTAAAHELADATLELHAILDAEQRAELLEQMQKRRGRHGHGWR